MRYRFGGCCLDLATRELRRDDRVVDLDRRTFAVLEMLIRHRDRVVPKEELLDEVWGDRFVSESALTTQIKYVRQAVGDDGRAQRVVKTVHGTGYRFVAGVDVEPEVEVEVEVDATTRQGSSLAHPAPVWSPEIRLFGREQEVEALDGLLRAHRLVTIVGPGGIGKTALARHLVGVAGPSGSNRTWFCDLLSTRDAASVPSVVLEAVGEAEQSDADPLESLVRALEGRRSILVLDNCEHLVASVPDTVAAVLRRCPDVRILATSTIPLGVEGEVLHPLSPLADVDARECFVARAAAVGTAVDRNDPALAELCRRLDGVPLAIELAAARARTLSPAEMLGFLTDRFRLLRTETTLDDERHRSLHATIAWSWDGLAVEDRELLSRLSVFVGSFTLEDARPVALPDGDPLDVVDAIGRLVTSSLLVALPNVSGRTRFRLLESIREFAAERLGDPTATRQAHVRHYAALVEELDADCQTPHVDAAVAATRAAWDNVRAAVGYAVEEGDIETVRRIVAAVGGYAELLQLFEVLHWCELVDLDELPEEGPDLPLAARALAVKASMLLHRGEQERGCALATRAHTRHESFHTLWSIVLCAYYAVDYDTVRRLRGRLVELSRGPDGLERGLVDSLTAIEHLWGALFAGVQRDPELESTVPSPHDAGRGLVGLRDCLVAGLRLYASDPARSVELLEAVVVESMRQEYRLLMAAASRPLTILALPARPPEEAMAVLRRTLMRYREHGMWRIVSADTVVAGRLLADHGDVDTASRLVGARVASGYLAGGPGIFVVELQGRLEQELGDRFAELAAQGARWRPPEAADAAIAGLSRALGEPVPARA